MSTYEHQPVTTRTAREDAASHGTSPQSRRALGRTAIWGLALFAVSLASFAPDPTPDAGTATAAQVRRFAADNATTIQLNTLAALASVALLVTFVAALAQQVRHVRPRSIGPDVMVALATVIAAQTLFQAAASSVFARPADLAGVSDGAIVSFYRFSALAEWLYTLTILLPCAALVATFSWLGMRCRLIARWVSFFGFAITVVAAFTTVVHIVPSTEFDPLVVPLFGWWLWPLAVGGASGVRWWRTRSRTAPHGETVPVTTRHP